MADPGYKNRIQNFKNKGKDQDVSIKTRLLENILEHKDSFHNFIAYNLS